MQRELSLKNKNALVMGLGLHDGGLGVTRFLVEQGAKVTVTDLRSEDTLAPTLEKLKDLPVRYVLGSHRETDFEQAELVVRNPAVPRESRFLQIARQSGASIEMEMTLFFKLCPSKLVLGITGTRGKTSSTIMLGEILKQWRPDTVVAGNLRISALEQLPHIKNDTPVALELSSWQLEGMGEQKISPPLAAITNMSPDHLNRYRDMADYADAKRQIYRWQGTGDTIILNQDDALVSTFAEDAPGHVRFFSLKEQPAGGGSYVSQAKFWWSTDASKDLAWHSCPLELLQVPGSHNQANALVAIALAAAAGCPPAAIEMGLANFKGVPDRLELVRTLHQVRYYNDTTATSPAGTIAALEALGSQPGQIILLLGGADKNLEFEPLIALLKQEGVRGKLKKIIMVAGSATSRLIAEISTAGLPAELISEPYTDFRRAIAVAQGVANAGDTVLLSPGCASFGMFTHEFERGEIFRQVVAHLK